MSIPTQYQIMSSVARVKFIKTNVIFRCYANDVSNQVSSDSDFIHVQFLLLKWEKKEKKENIFWVTKRDNKSGYKSGQALGITNRGKRSYKLGQL